MIKQKLLTLFVALTIATTLFASNTQVDGIWYDFDGTNLTASVTYRGGASSEYENEYTDSVVIPASVSYNGKTYSVTTIGEDAFWECGNLTSITMGNSVITIGSNAFCKCGNLTSITIPNSVTTIGDYAFYQCYKLAPITIGNSVTTIGDFAFYQCFELASITIGNSVTTIGDYAFSSCHGVTWVTIGNSVTMIGNYAFAGCSRLRLVTIPNSVTKIGEGAFSGCSDLTSIDVDAANTHYVSIDGVLFNHAKDTLIQCPASNSRTEYTIPSSVTTLGKFAFSDCSDLTSITIPNSVTTIGEYAFDGCTSLPVIDNIRYADTYLIGALNMNLSTYTIREGTTWIGFRAFNKCAMMTSIIIPKSVTRIGEEAFLYCEGLTSIIIPNSVTIIEDDAFRSCKSLTSVTIPNSVTSIGSSAFRNCSGLTSVAIGNSVTTIGEDAFSSCKGLTSVTISNSVTTIGEDAFYDCSGLTSITCETTTPPTCGVRCFYNVDKSIPVYVPAGSVAAYKNAYLWKDFRNIRPITAQEVEVTEIEAEPTESTVEIVWPIVVDAETYTIEIRLGDQLICSFVFNAQGQLLSINFNPAPSRGHMYAKTAVGTATGWAYTITGLNPGTNYTYSVVAKDATDQVIDTKNGSFTTTAPTGLLDINDNSKFLIQNSKLIKNGHLYILRDGNLYTATGARVK